SRPLAGTAMMNGALMVALAARPVRPRESGDPGIRMPAFGFWVPAFAGTNEECCSGTNGGGSWRASQGGEALDPDREADRRDRRRAAEPREQPVIAAAGHELACAAGRIVQLEYEARVVVEPAPERGREFDAPHVDAARRQKARATLKAIERA